MLFRHVFGLARGALKAPKYEYRDHIRFRNDLRVCHAMSTYPRGIVVFALVGADTLFLAIFALDRASAVPDRAFAASVSPSSTCRVAAALFVKPAPPPPFRAARAATIISRPRRSCILSSVPCLGSSLLPSYHSAVLVSVVDAVIARPFIISSTAAMFLFWPKFGHCVRSW